MMRQSANDAFGNTQKPLASKAAYTDLDKGIEWAVPAAIGAFGGPVGVGVGLAMRGVIGAARGEEAASAGPGGSENYNVNTDPSIWGSGNSNPNAGGSMATGINPGASQIPGFAAWQQQMQSGAASAQNRPGVQMNTGPSDQWRQRQMALYDQLARQASGQGPSLAQMQLQRGMDQNVSQAMAMQASQRGMGQAGAMRQIANQRAQIGQQMAGDSAQLRLQEQLQAQQQMGQLGNTARGQDLTLSDRQAQFQADQRKMNDQMVQFYLGKGMDMSQAQANANVTLEGIKSGNMIGMGNLGVTQDAATWAKISELMKGVGTGVSSFGAMGGGGSGGFSYMPSSVSSGSTYDPGSVSPPVDMSGG